MDDTGTIRLGLHEHMPAEAYFGQPFLGSTAIKTAAVDSVAHHLARREKDLTRAQRMGQIAHSAILEPGVLETRCVVAECGQCQARTSKGAQCSRNAVPGTNHCHQHGGNEEAELWLASLPPGTEVVTEDELAKARETAEGVRAAVARSDYPGLLDGGQREVSVFARAILTDEPPGYRLTIEGDEGLLVCGRFDLLYADLHAIIDVKGAGQTSMLAQRRWSWRIEDYGLHVQAAIYTDLGRVALGLQPEEDMHFTWLAHEQDKPHAARFYDACREDIVSGRSAVAVGLRRWKHYFDTKDPWAGWPRSRETVSRPGYVRDDDPEEV